MSFYLARRKTNPENRFGEDGKKKSVAHFCNQSGGGKKNTYLFSLTQRQDIVPPSHQNLLIDLWKNPPIFQPSLF